MKEKEPCQYCGKPTGNKIMHERHCPQNPKNSLSSSADKPPILSPPSNIISTPDNLSKTDISALIKQPEDIEKKIKSINKKILGIGFITSINCIVIIVFLLMLLWR